MTITAKERELMIEALDKGEKVLIRVYGKDARMRKSEKESARNLIQRGIDVPLILLRQVCMGLEYLYFCDNRQGEGISDLLGKLSKMCGYQRLGTLILEAKESA